ncbi:MAG TPA: class II aldolase/adducin family protein [Gemmatimonadaceae bacterium]|nr:class II aldolase/adducin family protein [Gemmatimonadaceae bacterium]
MNDDRARLAAAIVRVCHRLYARGLIAGAEGNVSARLSPDVILATTAGECKGDIDETHVVALTPDGRPLDPNRKPSTEIRMHLRIYEQRPDVRAVVHAHPPAATGFAVAGESLEAPVLPELMFLIGPVPLVPYGQPGTDELPDRLAPFVREHDAFLLANHGATTVGRTLNEALFRMESLEQGARIIATARQLGRVNELPAAAASALRTLRAASRGES